MKGKRMNGQKNEIEPKSYTTKKEHAKRTRHWYMAKEKTETFRIEEVDAWNGRR